MTRLDMTERSSFLNLLEESFPGIKSNIIRCEELGFPWVSKPFFTEEKGEILSHVGFLECPILIEGQQHKAAALQTAFHKNYCRKTM